MLASTLVSRDIVRRVLTNLDIFVDTHSYTEKTSDRDLTRRSVVFKIRIDENDTYIQKLVTNAIKREFNRYGFTNPVKLTIQQYPNFYYEPYVYVRTIATI